MGEQLSEEQIADFKEAFSLFDKDGDGIIKIAELALLIRSLNQNPTNSEIKEMINEIDPEQTGILDFPEFISLMARRIKDLNPEEELREAFQVLDRDKLGFISSTELKHLVSKWGEAFTEEEAEQMIKEADTEGIGQIRYEDFIKLLTTRYLY